MSARVDDFPSGAEKPRHVPAKRQSWQWFAGPSVLLASLLFYFANTSAESGSVGNILEYVRAELPQQGLLDRPHWMLVEVFDPANGTWERRRKDHVEPGEEFRAVNLLFKQVMVDGLSEIHGEVDVKSLDNAYAAFAPENVRNPTPDDVVYVLGEQLPKGGFHMLEYLGPDQLFRFQGRIFKTKPGSRADTVCVIDTGATFASAGGDPDVKLPLMVRTAYTDKFFPDPMLRNAESMESEQP